MKTVGFCLQVFGLLDMHEQLDSHLQVLSEVLSNTNSGSLLRVRCIQPDVNHILVIALNTHRQ